MEFEPTNELDVATVAYVHALGAARSFRQLCIMLASAGTLKPPMIEILRHQALSVFDELPRLLEYDAAEQRAIASFRESEDGAWQNVTLYADAREKRLPPPHMK